jgi:hypothetical protein
MLKELQGYRKMGATNELSVIATNWARRLGLLPVLLGGKWHVKNDNPRRDWYLLDYNGRVIHEDFREVAILKATDMKLFIDWDNLPAKESFRDYEYHRQAIWDKREEKSGSRVGDPEGGANS